MPGRRAPYVEHWPNRVGYLLLLFGGMQVFTWTYNESIVVDKSLILATVWICYGLPMLLVESSIGFNLGPPDAYFAAIPLLRGCLAALMFSLLLAIPFYSAEAIYSAMTGYNLLSALNGELYEKKLATVSDLYELTRTLGFNGTAAGPWIPPSVPDGLTVEGGVALVVVWCIIATICSVGPVSLCYVGGVFSVMSMILCAILLAYSGATVSAEGLTGILAGNIREDGWLSYAKWKECISFVNRQSLVGFGIFGTFAAYNGGIPAQGAKKTKRAARITAVCLTVWLCGYPGLWFAANLLRDSVHIALKNQTVGGKFNGDVISFGKWMCTIHVLKGAFAVVTTACMVEVFCTVWIRVFRASFPLRFKRYFLYRPIATVLISIVFASLTVPLLLNGGRQVFVVFHGMTVPFGVVELGQAVVWAAIQHSQTWDTMTRTKRKLRSHSLFCCRFLQTLGIFLFTAYLIILCIFRSYVFLEEELPTPAHWFSNDTFPTHVIRPIKIMILVLPILLGTIVTVITALRDLRGARGGGTVASGLNRLCCPVVIPNRAASAAGFYTGGIANHNANEHYWPEEFEVLPYDEQ